VQITEQDRRAHEGEAQVTEHTLARERAEHHGTDNDSERRAYLYDVAHLDFIPVEGKKDVVVLGLGVVGRNGGGQRRPASRLCM
jgi:hypothetical protein